VRDTVPCRIGDRLNELALPEKHVVPAARVGLQGATDADVVEYCKANRLYLLTASSNRVHRGYDLLPFTSAGVSVVQAKFGGTPTDTMLLYVGRAQRLLALCEEGHVFGFYLSRKGFEQMIP
jgi:hypothetical protein